MQSAENYRYGNDNSVDSSNRIEEEDILINQMM